MSAPLVLGIETSCDETGAGLVRGHELLADAIASSVAEHARFGGVVPEVASRAHLEAMVPTVDRALAMAGVTLAVAEPRQGQGLGAALLDALLAEAGRRGCSEVFLEVRVDNVRAQRLYQRRGFVEIGIRRGYYQPSGTDALVMRLTLDRTGGRGGPGPGEPARRPAGWGAR